MCNNPSAMNGWLNIGHRYNQAQCKTFARGNHTADFADLKLSSNTNNNRHGPYLMQIRQKVQLSTEKLYVSHTRIFRASSPIRDISSELGHAE